MRRTTRASLIHAVSKVPAIDVRQNERLIEGVARSQPNIHACVLLQKRLGLSTEKLNHLHYSMLVCFQAMKESGCPTVKDVLDPMAFARHCIGATRISLPTAVAPKPVEPALAPCVPWSRR